MKTYEITEVKGGWAVREGTNTDPDSLIAVGTTAEDALIAADLTSQKALPDNPAIADYIVACAVPGKERKISMLRFYLRLTGASLTEAKEAIEGAIARHSSRYGGPCW